MLRIDPDGYGTVATAAATVASRGAPSPRVHRLRRVLAPLGAAVLLLGLGGSAADAVTIASAWQAKIGSGGANGVATISAYTTGTGSLTLKLARLAPSRSLAVTLSKGTCGSVGATLIAFPAITTSSSGTAARTSTLAAAQVTKIRAATAGSGKMALRVGTGSTAKCGVFTVLAIPPYLAATITVGRDSIGLAVAPNGVLVANWYDGTLSRIDPATNSVLSVIPLTITGNEGPQVIAVGEGAVWVAMYAIDTAGQNTIAGSVERLNPVTGAVTATIPIGKAPVDITTSPGAVWVANFDDGTVTRIDPATNQVAATITLAPGVAGVTFDFGSLWVSNEQTGTVSRIDPATNMVVATIPTVGSPEDTVSAVGAIWVANWGTTGQPDGVVSRIDPATNQVTKTIPVGTNPLYMASGGGSIWVGMSGEPTIVEVNPVTFTVTRIVTGASVLDSSGEVIGLADIVATDHAVWATQDLPAPDTTSPPPPSKLYRVNY